MIDLKAFSFFNTLPTREVDKLKQVSRFKKYASGTVILKEKEDVSDLIMVVEGQVSVIKTYGEKKTTLFTLDPGEIYGEVEILNGTKCLTTLIGYQEFQVIYIPKDFFLRLIGLYPGFAKETRDLYSRRGQILLEEGMSKSQFGKVVTFFNVKGGAGKSVISSNVAVMLAKYWKKKTVLLDMNLAFGDQAILLGLSQEKNIHLLTKAKQPLNIKRIEEQLTDHSSGLKVLLPPAVPELAELIKPEFVESVIEILKNHYDFIIIDTHNQMSDLELKILENSDLIMLMMTMELTFIKNTKILLDLLGRLKIPKEKIKVVLNRAFKSMGLEPSKVEKSLRYAISHFIPSEGNIVVPSVNQGTPFVLSKGSDGSAILLSVRKLCSRLTGEEIEKGTWNMFSLLKEVFGL
ncbi:MAG: cyclic nucleotide-binding domain-containing protein [Candidatus Riflebacteria bacterium]